MEQWKSIEEFEKTKKTKEMYISNFGNIKRITTKNIEIIGNGLLTKNNYRRICINKKQFLVHRLVLKYFTGPCPENMECDHINSIRDDNHISNLIWITKSNNCKKRRPYLRNVRKNKKGCIRKRVNYEFVYTINKQTKSKTFKTEIEAKIAQAFYKGSINIIEKYQKPQRYYKCETITICNTYTNPFIKK